MTARPRILVGLVLIWCFGLLAASADSLQISHGLAVEPPRLDLVRIEGPGTYRLLARMRDGKSLTAVVRVVAIPPGWYAGNGDHAKTLVTRLEIERQKKPVLVGLSAYADLFDPREMLFEFRSKGTRLVITGGDASTSYKVVMLLGAQHVSRREVYSLAPEPVERTIYWLRGLKDSQGRINRHSARGAMTARCRIMAARSAIAFVLVFAFTAQASDEAAPRGWRFPTEADYREGWAEYRDRFPVPFHVRGDFNGDGIVDDGSSFATGTKGAACSCFLRGQAADRA